MHCFFVGVGDNQLSTALSSIFIPPKYQMPKDAKEEYISFGKTVCVGVARLERYEEALLLFNENPIVFNERVQLSPNDIATRVLSNNLYSSLSLSLRKSRKVRGTGESHSR